MFSPASTTTARRVAGIIINNTTFETIRRPRDWVAVLWAALDVCVVPAEQRFVRGRLAGNNNDNTSIPVALKKIGIEFPFSCEGEPRANAPILGPLTTNHPMLVRSLEELKIENNKHDESAALGAFAALATHLTALTISTCGLTSVLGLAGAGGLRCERLQKVNFSSCNTLSSLEGLEQHLFLEEVDASCTGITSVDPLLTCPVLTKVELRGCHRLSSIDGLAGHQRLQTLSAFGTNISSVEALFTCPALKTVDVRICRRLPCDVDFPAHVEVIR